MSKVHYLNSHLHKFREKSKITIDVENIGDLADYNTFGKEDKKTTKIFTECFNNKESYTPFFDSIYNQSLHFDNSIANGASSLDALPSILASFPSWMNESYILSSYTGNKLNGLPYYLNKIGYESLFFHGANNGSMRFNAFTKKIGFEKYYFRLFNSIK